MSRSDHIQVRLNEQKEREIQQQLKKEAAERKRKRDEAERERVATQFKIDKKMCEKALEGLKVQANAQKATLASYINLTEFEVRKKQLADELIRANNVNQLPSLAELNSLLLKAKNEAINKKYIADKARAFKEFKLSLLAELEQHKASAKQLMLKEHLDLLTNEIEYINIGIQQDSEVTLIQGQLQKLKLDVIAFQNLVETHAQNLKQRQELISRLGNFLKSIDTDIDYVPSEYAEFERFCKYSESQLKDYQPALEAIEGEIGKQCSQLEQAINQSKLNIKKQNEIVDAVKQSLITMNHQYTLTWSSNEPNASAILDTDKNLTLTIPTNTPEAKVNMHYQHENHQVCIKKAEQIINKLSSLLKEKGVEFQGEQPPSNNEQQIPKSTIQRKNRHV